MGLLDFASSAWNTVTDFFSSSSSSGGGGRDYGGSYSSSSSSTVTNYDPDKVEVAKLENERVHLVKEAQQAMIEARCRGFQAMQGAMMNMLKEVNILAEERLILLENGSREQVQKVEAMYADLAKDIENDQFMFEKVPQLLDMANKFPEDSASHKMFMQGIDREMATHFDFKTEQLKKLNERRQTVLDSVVESKKQMQAHIDLVVTKRIEQIEQVMQHNAQLEFKGTALQLDVAQSKTAQIEHKPN